jgi:hypothetical protein
MSPTAASAMLEPEKRTLAEEFDLLLSSMSESTLSRVLTATSARDVRVILRKFYAGKHASTVLAYENEIHQQRYKDGTSTVLEYWLLSIALLQEQCPMSVLHLQCCGPSTTHQPTRESLLLFE